MTLAMTGRKTQLTVLRLLVLIVTILVVVGCGSSTAVPQPDGDPGREPFSARRESEDGDVVAWSGYTQGYEPGADADFEITIKNGTDRDWDGRFCLHLMGRRSHRVVATLAQREFTLEPDVGFSDTIEVQLPEALDAGAYGLSLAVRRPGGSMVDLVPIEIGVTDEVRRATTQQDVDVSLAACPPVEGVNDLVERAKADLVQRLDVDLGAIAVRGVEPTEFPDAGLGVPEPGETYAQVVISGYVIELGVGGEVYRYHAANDRVVMATDDEEQSPGGSITIAGVSVTGDDVTVRGVTSLPDGSCLVAELWADGVQERRWSSDTCVAVDRGDWELEMPVDPDSVLQPGIQYMLRVYQDGGPNIVATFPFDLDGPPSPPSRGSVEDPLMLLPESAEPYRRTGADLDGDEVSEEIVLAGWGGSSNRLGYDFLQMFVVEVAESGRCRIAWQSEQLPTQRAEVLEVRDVNGDGRPEVLSVQAMGAGGEVLYLLGRQADAYGWLSPQGGHFEGQDAFGESGVRVEDLDDDGLAEILADYGPASKWSDVYRWDGQSYVYEETLDLFQISE